MLQELKDQGIIQFLADSTKKRVLIVNPPLPEEDNGDIASYFDFPILIGNIDPENYPNALSLKLTTAKLAEWVLPIFDLIFVFPRPAGTLFDFNNVKELLAPDGAMFVTGMEVPDDLRCTVYGTFKRVYTRHFGK